MSHTAHARPPKRCRAGRACSEIGIAVVHAHADASPSRGASASDWNTPKGCACGPCVHVRRSHLGRWRPEVIRMEVAR